MREGSSVQGVCNACQCVKAGVKAGSSSPIQFVKAGGSSPALNGGSNPRFYRANAVAFMRAKAVGSPAASAPLARSNAPTALAPLQPGLEPPLLMRGGGPAFVEAGGSSPHATRSTRPHRFASIRVDSRKASGSSPWSMRAARAASIREG